MGYNDRPSIVLKPLEEFEEAIANMSEEDLVSNLDLAVFNDLYLSSNGEFSSRFERIVERLLELKWDLNSPISLWSSLLHYAVMHCQNLELVNFLLNKGADPNVILVDKSPLLLEAMFYIDITIVDRLIESGAEVDFDQWNAFGFIRTVDILNRAIHCGYNIHSQTGPDGNYQIHFAAYTGRVELVNRLIELGVNVNALNDLGQSALTWVCDKPVDAKHLEWCDLGSYTDSDTEVLKALVDAGADINFEYTSRKSLKTNPLLATCASGFPEIPLILIRSGRLTNEFVNSSTKNGRTPLFYACKTGNVELVNKLIEMGADLNSEDRLFRTPIEAALKHHHYYIVKLLHEKGATVIARKQRAFSYYTKRGGV